MADLRCRTCRTAAAFAVCIVSASATAENRNALRDIVEDQCLVHWRQSHSASPCRRVELPEANGAKDGYAVLADRKGGAHFLVIPTRTISGIESSALQEADAPNFFDGAWSARAELDGVVGHAVPRQLVGMAVNSRNARSQDQLHIHIECLQPLIRSSLQQSAERLTDAWSPIDVPGWRLLARSVRSERLGPVDPFKLLAAGLAGPENSLGDYSLLVAGMNFEAGPGFIVLAGTGPGTERLLDSTCALAKP
jgi:CDP-diacylglycerol pyrophosphatase